jgi:hypothetical protein
MARLACVPSELGSAADYPKETIIPQKPPPDEARSFGCLSSIILSPLNGNVKMSPYETGEIHVATTGSGVMALRFGRIPDISRGRGRWLWRRCRRRSRSPVFSAVMLALLHRLFQFFLVIGKQGMNLAVRFVADSVNLRTKLLPRSCRILIEQRLNPILVLLKQRPDLLPLFRSQLQIFRKASKFLVDRLRRMDMLKLLTRRGLLYRIVLSYGRTGHSDNEHSPMCKRQRSISHDSNLLEYPRPNPSRDSHLNRWPIPQKRYVWSPLTPCSVLICRSALTPPEVLAPRVRSRCPRGREVRCRIRMALGGGSEKHAVFGKGPVATG